MNNDVIQKVHHWCHKVLPLVYDDSLSYYEVVCKLVAKINEMIEAMNGYDEKILTVVKEYIASKEFLSYVEGIVSPLITERDETPRSNDLALHRIFSKVERSSFAFPDEVHYNVPQSCCYNPETNTIIVAWCKEYRGVSTSTLANLVEYNLSDMSVVRKSLIGVHHANGMTFDTKKQKIYVCGLDEMTVDGVTGYGFRVVDYATLTIEQEVLLDMNPIGCGIDEEKGLIYFSGADYLIHVVDNDTYKTVRGFYLDMPVAHGSAYQDIDMHDGLLYCIFWRPNTICVFDLNGNNVRNYNVPKWCDQIYRFHEAESLCYVGGGNFVITGYGNYEPAHYTGEGVFGVINFNKNVMDAPADMLNFHSHQATHDLYVDSSERNQLNTNPIGSNDSPFRSVQEALSSVRSPYFDGGINLYITGGEKEPYPVTMSGINKVIRFRGTYQFDNMSILYSENVTFGSGFKFVSTVKNSACVLVYNSTVTLTDNVIEKGECTFGVSCENGRLLLSLPNVPMIDTYLAGSDVKLNRVTDTSKITVYDTTCEVNIPITVFTGEFTVGDLATRFDPKRFPWATLMIKGGEWCQHIDVRTRTATNQRIYVRALVGTDVYDLYIGVSFNVENGIHIYQTYYSLNGAAPVYGFPDGFYIAEVQLHN